MTYSQKKEDEILIDLALQGGGAHGAFTWGVLDRVLEEKSFESMVFLVHLLGL